MEVVERNVFQTSRGGRIGCPLEHQARYPQRNAEAKRARWQQQHRHLLKHDPDALDALATEAARLSRRGALSQRLRDGAYSAWTYLNNHRHQMDDPAFLAEGLPIGSGVTDPVCKTLVKERQCASGMRWKTKAKAPASCSVCAPSPKPPDAGRSSGKRSISLGKNAAAEHNLVMLSAFWEGSTLSI